MKKRVSLSDPGPDEATSDSIERVQRENFAIRFQFFWDAARVNKSLLASCDRPLLVLLEFATLHGYRGSSFLDAGHYVERYQLQAAFDAYAPGVAQDVLGRLPRDAKGCLTTPFAPS